METLKKLLELANGRKTTIASVLMLIIIFCVNRGYIQQDVSELIASILVALGISANYANYRMKK